jgi:hypothetical protein
MRISRFAEPRGVVYPSVIAKMLLAKEVIEHIIEKFVTKTKEDWEDRPARDIKCKKSETKRVITEIPTDGSSRRCLKVVNWISIDGLEGPFLIKNNIVFYNREQRLLLVIMCPSFVNIPDDITDVWVRKIIPFTYGNTNFDIPEIVGEINMDEFFEKSVYSTIFGKDRENVLKLHRVYGTFQWETSPIVESNRETGGDDAEDESLPEETKVRVVSAEKDRNYYKLTR